MNHFLHECVNYCYSIMILYYILFSKLIENYFIYFQCVQQVSSKMVKCAVPECKNNTRCSVRMNMIPSDKSRQQQWVKNAGLDITKLKKKSYCILKLVNNK